MSNVEWDYGSFKLLRFNTFLKIEDAVHRAENFALTALEEMVWDFDMWNDPAKSNDILVKLENSAKVVDSLRDLKYKNYLILPLATVNISSAANPLACCLWSTILLVEEAKLINQLAEINVIDYGLYKQAYETSLDVSEILDQYEISKLLKGPFDMAGACLVIKAGPNGIYSKDRCKCWGRISIGSSEEISSDDSESEIGTQMMNGDVMSEIEPSEEDFLPSAEGDEQG
ncbi:hypothetical protein JHK87_004585 [Glycine soja]|nr:hypothetical protein JHK87_004585 [Glycine soja]